MNSPFQFGSVNRSRYEPQSMQPWQARGQELQSTIKEINPEIQQSMGEKSADALALEQQGGTLMQQERQSLGAPTVYKANYGSDQFQQDVGSRYAPVLKEWGVGNLQGQKAWVDPSKLQAVQSNITGLESSAGTLSQSSLNDYTTKVSGLKSRYGTAVEEGLKNIRDWQAAQNDITQQSGAAQIYADNQLTGQAISDYANTLPDEERMNFYSMSPQDQAARANVAGHKANYLNPFQTRLNELGGAISAKRAELGI